MRPYRRTIPFSPQNFAALDGWWDASDMGTLALSGANVSTWYDKGPNGRHVAEATNPPAWAQNAASTGYPGVTFDGTNDQLTRAAAWSGPSGACMWFLVATTATAGTNKYLVSEGSTASNTPVYSLFRNSSPATTATSQITTDAGVNSVSNAPTSGNGFGTLVLLARSDDSSIIRGYRNGATSNTQSYTRGTSTLNTFAMGARAKASPDTWMNATIHELLMIVGRVPTARERNLLDGYLAHKWGITLTTDHPWANATP